MGPERQPCSSVGWMLLCNKTPLWLRKRVQSPWDICFVQSNLACSEHHQWSLHLSFVGCLSCTLTRTLKTLSQTLSCIITHWLLLILVSIFSATLFEEPPREPSVWTHIPLSIEFQKLAQIGWVGFTNCVSSFSGREKKQNHHTRWPNNSFQYTEPWRQSSTSSHAPQPVGQLDCTEHASSSSCWQPIREGKRASCVTLMHLPPSTSRPSRTGILFRR